MLLDMRPGTPSFADVQELVGLGIEEGPELDYKKQLPGRPPSEHKELLKDVCALANANGGWLVYGVPEELDADGKKTGLPGEIVGVGDINDDEERLRLQSIIRQGIAPRLEANPFVVRSEAGLTCVALWVPPSTYPPCMVISGSDSRFWMRQGGGKYAMDIEQIRRAFVESETWLERLRSFREERLKAIGGVGAGPGLLMPPWRGRLAMHVAPLSSMRGGRLDVVGACRAHPAMPMNTLNLTTRINLDGFIRFSTSHDGHLVSYIQVFRSGVIESVDCLVFKGHGHERPENHHIFEEDFVSLIGSQVRDQLPLLEELALAPPYVVMVSLLGVNSWELAYSSTRGGVLDRDDIVLPELLLERREDVDAALAEIDELLWQAAGLERRPQ